MALPLPLKIVKNPWMYYLLKAGLLCKAELTFRSVPDELRKSFDAKTITGSRVAFKALLKAVRDGVLRYQASDDIMEIRAGKGVHSLAFDMTAIETLRGAQECGLELDVGEDPQFFLLTIPGGVRFLVRRDVVSDVQVVRETCLLQEYRFVYPYLDKAVVVDVGANIGDTAVLFSRLGARRVVAFEPHPFMADMARRNVQLNGLEDVVEVRSSGIGSCHKKLEIREDHDQGATAGFGLKEARRGRLVLVDVVPMSEIIDELGSIDVLKMDCEGAEFDIVAGLGKERLRNIRTIALEFHRDPQPLISLLESVGFQTKIIVNFSPGFGLMLAHQPGV